MRVEDNLRFSSSALTAARGRSWLMLLAMAIGVGSVVVLTALGEGARRYVADEFSSMGTHLLIVLPGKTETAGGAPPLVGGTPNDLTLYDALALERSGYVRRMAPIIIGSAPASYRQLEREITVAGSTHELAPIRNFELARGRFLPPGDPTRAAAVTVIGSKLKQELFGGRKAVGEWLRIDDRRFRVIGVLKPLGQSLGLDVGDLAVVPVASAQNLFNTEALFRVLVQAQSREAIPKAKAAVIEILKERHNGEEDVTIITQNALLTTFDGIFRALTFTVGGIAAISLAVAGILIMNVMLVAVSQRTFEIGLLKALGCPRRDILRLFLVEAAMLSVLGAMIGVAVAYLGVWGIGLLLPAFPVTAPLWSLFAAVAVALATGLLFGVIPARKAAALDPVLALSGQRS